MEPETAIRAARRLATFVPASPTPGSAGSYAASEVEKLIPHRPPFRFLDGITWVDLEARRIGGFRDVPADDPVFDGHFPDDPVFPGVLQVEAIGQLGLCLADFVRRASTALPAAGEAAAVRAVRVHHGLFLAPVPPGARLDLYAEILELDELLGVVAGQARTGDDVCCTVVLEVFFV